MAYVDHNRWEPKGIGRVTIKWVCVLESHVFPLSLRVSVDTSRRYFKPTVVSAPCANGCAPLDISQNPPLTMKIQCISR